MLSNDGLISWTVRSGPNAIIRARQATVLSMPLGIVHEKLEFHLVLDVASKVAPKLLLGPYCRDSVIAF